MASSNVRSVLSVTTRPPSDTALLGRVETAPPGAGGRGTDDTRPRLVPARMGARTSVLLACLLTLALHLIFLSPELTSDEGGFAMVARGWRAPGPYLYGAQWVDRPPALMVVFDAAQALGPLGVRLVATVLATVLVAAAAWAAGAVRGGRAAGWSAWTAFAFACSPFLGAYQLNGELIAAPLVMIACAAALHALYRYPGPTPTVLLGLLAGASATAALLVKQNFADGLVFVAVLTLGSVLVRRCSPRRVMLASAGAITGVGVLVGAALWWAGSHAGVPALVYAMYGFRADAGDVIAQHSLAAPEARLATMGVLALASGMVLLVVQLLAGHWRTMLALSPVAWAVTGAVAVELVGVALGASYWPHYLIALIPTLALVTGLAAGNPRPGLPPSERARRGRRRTQLVAALAVLTTVVAAPVDALAVHGYHSHSYRVGRWIASSARPTDTLVVPFTHANVIGASGLGSPYPYSWSLPVRTLDPHVALLTRTLSRSHGAPTWVVRWDPPHQWGLDPRDRVAHALTTHYRPVAFVCGHAVWLHRGVDRTLAAAPTGCGPSYTVAAPATSSSEGIG